jgi:hypothetical protein
MNKRTKNFYKQIGYILLSIFFIRCFISRETLFQQFNLYELIGCMSDSVAITSLIMFAYEKFLWRWNPFESIPKLYSHYNGTLISSYDNQCRNATLYIRQTLLSVQIKLQTDESRSSSVNASIVDLYGDKCLLYTYLNTPNALVRDRSAIHYGTASLCINNDTLSGDYFTDRKTTGVMNFKSTIKK